MPEPMLEIAGVTAGYGRTMVLFDVDLSIPVGGAAAVMGHNGAGKTTLLRVLATLLRPHAGSVRVLGAELPREAWKVRGQVGYLGHEPLLYRELSGRENLKLYAELHRVETERVEELIDAVGMARRAGDPVRDLSRGMVQRFAAARAVLHDPPLLLLDEPRANLDPAAADLLEPLVGRASGRARVVVTHDVDGGLAECDTALGLRGGRQVFCGKVPAETVRELYA